ncbi:unnamed protein product [Cyprideis torosa]|uniref:Uncharacterized protein n=1 Tax=Cyprideis torosa TaxID=163714 RepID=A0A7R8WHR2_9CRUS|nr:unnamed protein product [Cyprideis torosa]CAG0897819.1 unnamed protein product [Cyprideis torosa]
MPLTGKRRKNAVRNKLKDAAKRPLPGRKPADDDEEITSSSSSDEEENAAEGVVRTAPQEEEEEAEDLETPQEKRLRLTKKYLEEIASMEEGKSMSLHDAVSSRLKEDVLEQAGRLRKALADKIEGVESSAVLRAKEMRLAPTCLVLAPDNDSLFAAGKDGVIVKWSISSGQKLCCTPRGNRRRPHEEGEEEGAEPQTHSSAVLCLDVSSDGRLLVSGDASAAILVWAPLDLSFIRRFRGHRGPVTGVAFRKGSRELYSASMDRSLKVWNLEEMTYVQTLFGHQDGVQALCALSRPRAVSCGGRDATLRVWKVAEETQLVYNGSEEEGSMDCLALLNDETIVTGSEAGWRPFDLLVCSEVRCFLSPAGSSDGVVRVWRHLEGAAGRSRLEPLLEHPLVGFVNCLRFLPHGGGLLCAVGQEHRLGRWWRDKKAKNSVCVLRFKWCCFSVLVSFPEPSWPSREGASRSRLEPLLEHPLVGFVNCLRFLPHGGGLLCAVGQEHRLGRWWRDKKAKNSVCVLRFKLKE